jgi:hypothetical protein
LQNIKLSFEKIIVSDNKLWRVKAIDDFDYEYYGYGETPRAAVYNFIDCLLYSCKDDTLYQGVFSGKFWNQLAEREEKEES